MENRDKYIDELIERIIKLIDSNEEFDINNLKLSEKFFLQEEIMEYNEKIDIIKYLKKEKNKKIFIEKNLEVLIFFIKDIKLFLLNLKKKRIKLLENIFNECIVSLENYKKLQNFMYNERIYLPHYSHYFTNEEVDKYKEVWNALEEFILIDIDNEKNINEYWQRNFEKIKNKILELVLFINKICRE
ncbi:MAG: hypothetical protein SPJ84_04540 [Fusobacterium gastrosuis]|uniref:hypothetical protein n=1 Tax=Fusobacterium TaxID=848 RepID=UPI0025C40B29|nr:hypothetical protein [Fusobacterium sp.]MCI7223122.1 hypothetical protein [Fusobacterium sp.]MDY5795077.1 hypothetical protein [Fusobacterium gastrosuis]